MAAVALDNLQAAEGESSPEPSHVDPLLIFENILLNDRSEMPSLLTSHVLWIAA